MLRARGRREGSCVHVAAVFLVGMLGDEGKRAKSNRKHKPRLASLSLSVFLTVLLRSWFRGGRSADPPNMVCCPVLVGMTEITEAGSTSERQ